MKGLQPPTATLYDIVVRGDAADIRLAPTAYAAYVAARAGTDKISMQRKAHLERYFREFCEHNPHRLTDEKFKKEQTFATAHGKVAVWAFKAWQWRLYGSILTVAGKRTFVGTRVDDSKKQNKANKTLLKLAADDIARLIEFQSKGK
ncbi:MAG TPA: hypothetical protein VFB16_01010 [Bauldia sp.]|nr:hypothetical protein [Bauldia sp.]